MESLWNEFLRVIVRKIRNPWFQYRLYADDAYVKLFPLKTYPLNSRLLDLITFWMFLQLDGLQSSLAFCLQNILLLNLCSEGCFYFVIWIILPG